MHASSSHAIAAVIVEATYGVSSHQPREEREELFCSRVRDIVQRGGRVLLPCVALGRAQVQCQLACLLEADAGQCRVCSFESSSPLAAQQAGLSLVASQ